MRDSEARNGDVGEVFEVADPTQSASYSGPFRRWRSRLLLWYVLQENMNGNKPVGLAKDKMALWFVARIVRIELRLRCADGLRKSALR